jgi:hypothetical protein
LCGWEDAGSDVVPARLVFCVDALRIYPVTILGAGCPVRSGARCGMFTVQVACESVVSRGENIPLGWLFICCECCVLSGRVLWDGLITRPEESYRLARRCV